MNRFAILTLVLLTGCGASGSVNKLPTYKVTGKLTLDGNPIPGVTVTFSPTTADKPPANGVTDSQGVYSLSTYDLGDGAPEGEYKIKLYKPSGGGGANAASSAPSHDTTGKSGKSGPASHAKTPTKSAGDLPEKYTGVDSPIKKSVTSSGPQTIDIELTK